MATYVGDCEQSLTAMGHSEEEAADEASMVRSQLAFARARAGKGAAAAEQLKQIVRSRYDGCCCCCCSCRCCLSDMLAVCLVLPPPPPPLLLPRA